MGWLLALGPRRVLLGVLAAVCVLAGVTWSGGVASGQTGGLPDLTGDWDVTFTSPPCVQGCSDTWTFTESATNTYDIANGEGFHSLGVVVSGGASAASAQSCWTAPPVANSNCPGGRSAGAGYTTVTMNFVFPSNGQWKITGDISEFTPNGTPLPPVLPYVATMTHGGCKVGGSRDGGPLLRPATLLASSETNPRAKTAASGCGRKTVTTVSCKYPSYLLPGAAISSCLVQVTDQGPPPAQTPTGTVKVSYTPAGTGALFHISKPPEAGPAGPNKCTLQVAPGSVSTSEPDTTECRFDVAGTERFRGGRFVVHAAYQPGPFVYKPSKGSTALTWPHLPFQTKLATVTIRGSNQLHPPEVIGRGGARFRFCDGTRIPVDPYAVGLGGTYNQYSFHLYPHNGPVHHYRCETFKLPSVSSPKLFAYYVGSISVHGSIGYGLIVP
jgi:hypothetical protein